MSKSTLRQFSAAVKKYRKAHPSTSFRNAQKAVSRARKTKGKKKPAARKAAPRKKPRKVSGSRPAVRTSVQLGSVKSMLSTVRKRITAEYGKLQGQLLTAKSAKRKKSLKKSITNKRLQLRKLS